MTSPPRDGPVAAVVLAGGGGHRLGGVDKPGLHAGRRTLLEIVLAALQPARGPNPQNTVPNPGPQFLPTVAPHSSTVAADGPVSCGGPAVVVVGPPRELPAGVALTREDPPGGGPAAALAAGFRALPELPPSGLVAVLAADLPLITGGTVARLCRAVSADPLVGGAVLIDLDGRRQHLIGVWRSASLAWAISQRQRRQDWHGCSLRGLFAPIPVAEVPSVGDEAADVDNTADLRRWLPR